jgi:hypothetical protein
MTTQHVFEAAGLGLAPFRCVGMHTEVGPRNLGNGVSVGAPGQPMGCCDYCGTGILYCFEIVSTDGKAFIVGSDCVYKTGDAGLRKVVDAKLKAIKDEATDKRIRAGFDLFYSSDAIRAKLGESTCNYIDFCQKHAGRSGALKCARMIEKAAE